MLSNVDTPTSNVYPQLISLAVHELRTPASVVGGYLRMLLRDTETPLSDRQRRMLEEAEKSCTRFVAIVAEMSEVGKLDAGLVSVAQQPLDVFALIAEVAELVHEGEDRGVRLELRGVPEGASTMGDAKRLRQAFEAIFRAILREKPGQVTVVAERRLDTVDGRRCAVLVVAEEASVQAAYDREAGPFDDRRGGMGLALPLARRVIEAHGGRLWAPAADGAVNPDTSDESRPDDPLARGSAIIALPITELSR
jgi:two-component system cell cycle sensor histidine kinase PleC